MKNLFQNKNFRIITLLIVFVAIVAVIGTQTRVQQHDLNTAVTAAPTAEPTVEPVVEATESDLATATDAATITDLATETDLATVTDLDIDEITGVHWRDVLYLVVTTSKGTYYPQPLVSERDIEIEQDDGMVNTVHVSPEGAYMASSTCENQDCVGQGEVTRENKASRILGNYILCLPNQVQLEVLTYDELVESFGLSNYSYLQVVYLLMQPYLGANS